jgi:hypothetical protein
MLLPMEINNGVIEKLVGTSAFMCEATFCPSTPGSIR